MVLVYKKKKNIGIWLGLVSTCSCMRVLMAEEIMRSYNAQCNPMESP